MVDVGCYRSEGISMRLSRIEDNRRVARVRASITFCSAHKLHIIEDAVVLEQGFGGCNSLVTSPDASQSDCIAPITINEIYVPSEPFGRIFIELSDILVVHSYNMSGFRSVGGYTSKNTRLRRKD